MTQSMDEILPRDLFASDGAMSAAHARAFRAIEATAMGARASGYEEALQMAVQLPVARHDALLQTQVVALRKAKSQAQAGKG